VKSFITLTLGKMGFTSTLRKGTFSIMTLTIMSLFVTLSIASLGIMTLSKMGSILTLGKKEIQHNNNQHIGINFNIQ